MSTKRAAQLCVTRQTVSKWEQGINEPDIDTLKKPTKIFGVSTGEIVGATFSTTSAPKTSKLQNASKTLFAVILLFVAFCAVAVAIYRLNKRYPKAQVAALSIVLAVQTSLCASMFALHLTNTSSMNANYLPPLLLCIATDLMGVAGAAYHPRLLPPNEIIGFRTRFTLSNPEAWCKVNTLLAYMLPACCAVYLTAILITSTTNNVALLTGELTALIVPIIAVTIYHEVLRNRLKHANKAG